MRNPSDIEDGWISKVGDCGLTGLAGFLLKLEKAEVNIEAQKSGPSLKRVQRSPNKFWSRKTL